MNIKVLVGAFLMFALGQAIVWFQVNAPIIWQIPKTYKLVLISLGIPITWLFMQATAAAVNAFDGQFWPGRFLSFVTGIIIFTVLTWWFCGEGITAKTAVSLCLCCMIIIIQLFWK
jgi:hypothetical protein